MQLRHLKTILPPTEGISKVTAICWSPNNRRLAVCTADRVVHLFDDNGERRDKFSTKPADAKGPKNYVVRGMAFSPDSSKLAIAQSDNIVFVYKLGLEWGDKKSICNKFHQNSSVTCITWPHAHPNEVVFGLAEGKVKIGQLRSNKPATLYGTETYVMCLSSSPDGNGVISGHADGSIYRFFFDDGQSAAAQAKLVHHPCVPYALSWGESIVAAGSDFKVSFYDRDGIMLQQFDYNQDEKQKEFTVASFNPSGECAVVGSFNRFHVFAFNPRRNVWEESGVREVDNMYTVTAACWKPDGSRLAIGNLTGAVDVYDACIRRYRYKGKFEFTYVSPSQVIVKRLSTGTRIVLKSHFHYEITKINIYRDRFLIAHTPDTLLMGDLETCKLSEIPWSGSGTEKFIFDHDQVCMIFNADELTIVEYGRNEVLGSCRTAHMSPHLLSVRINEETRAPAAPPPPPAAAPAAAAAKGAAGGDEMGGEDEGEGNKEEMEAPPPPPPAPEVEENKKIAYLIDLHTIRVTDLTSGVAVANINHDSKVDWLELNINGTKLLFRDKRRQLILFDIASQSKSTLLSYCSYVQWVPHSDVVVAQNRGNLCVWYSIDAPDRVTIFPIKGDVEEIERAKGRTEVIVDEGINTVSYQLDESLIEFGAAMKLKKYEKAVEILEQMLLTPETESMWASLSQAALKDGRVAIAARCAAALGDVARARYLHKIVEAAERASAEAGGYGDGMNHFSVRARMHLLNRNFRAAEQALLEQNQVDACIDMYMELQKWDEVIAVADMKQHADAKKIKEDYYKWLLQSNQEEKAGLLKEKEGTMDAYLQAIDLYLKGGLPGRAAACVSNHPGNYSASLLDKIAGALSSSGMHEKAGDFFEKLQKYDRAIESYRRGAAFRRAVDLARRMFPDQVVKLEDEWGDHLMKQKQVDAAVAHFIEAGQARKALEAAVQARQFNKAVGIADGLRPDEAKPYFARIAKHFDESRQFKEAERFYVKAGMPQEAVDMYTKNNMWEDAHSVAMSYMTESQVALLYITQANRLEAAGKLKEAEKLYITVKEPDLAINMYKKNKQYDQMIRLVGQYRKDLLVDTHLHLAQQLETEQNYRDAEKHYVEAKDWKSAVNMYRSAEMWDDAVRVAKIHGGVTASKQVAYAWAVSLGGEAGAKLLTKFGLVEQAIDYAMDSGNYTHAFELAKGSLKQKLPEVHLKYAMFLEDEGKFAEAEGEFVAASKPKEAIDMYLHQQDWLSAMRVAENHDPGSVPDVLVAQARVAMEGKQLQRAEALFVKARKAELAVKMYRDAKMWPEALRVCKDHLPHRLADLESEYKRATSTAGPAAGAAAGGAANDGSAGRMWEDAGEYSKAIDAYLRLSADTVSNKDLLEEKWTRAVQLAVQYVPDRTNEVVGAVSRKLAEIGRHAQAAEVLEGVDKFKEAIDVYIAAGMFDRARMLAQSSLPSYVEAVERAYASSSHGGGRGRGGASAPSAGGDEGGASLDQLAARNQWEKVFEEARSKGPQVMQKYALQHASQLLTENKPVDAARTLAKNGVQIVPAGLPVYKKLAREIFGRQSSDGIDEVRQVLVAVVDGLKSGTEGGGAGAAKPFEKLLLVAHYLSVRALAKEKGLGDLAMKISVALLRYIGEGGPPADKAFLEAGMSCREAQPQPRLNMAFVFLNRYLDLTEAMDDESMRIENADFEKTDIPFDFPMPEKHFLPEDRREELRDWVLQISMDRKVEQSLSTRKCEKCSTEIYEASLKCAQCGYEHEACVVGGYPVMRFSKIECKGCNKVANREDWNKLVQKTKACPWCATPAAPQY